MTAGTRRHDRLSICDDQPILRMIRQTGRISGLVAGTILFLIVGPPLLKGLLGGHPVYAVVNAALLTLLALVLIAVVEILALMPIAAVRYRCSARAIERELATLVPNPVLRWSAHRGTPGVLAIARGVGGGRLLLCDLSTRYRWISLRSAQVLHARPVVQTRHARGSRMSFGVGVTVGGGLMVRLPLEAGRPKAPTSRFAVILTISHDSDIDGGMTCLRCRDAEHAQTLAAQIAHWANTGASRQVAETPSTESS